MTIHVCVCMSVCVCKQRWAYEDMSERELGEFMNVPSVM